MTHSIHIEHAEAGYRWKCSGCKAEGSADHAEWMRAYLFGLQHLSIELEHKP